MDNGMKGVCAVPTPTFGLLLPLSHPFKMSVTNPRHHAVFVAAFCSLMVCSNTLLGGEPDFQSQIQPILAEHCSQCHGGDEATRESNLRLDTRQGALQGGDSSEPAIVAGNAGASELVRRILSTDPDSVMPPPSIQKPLSAEQIALLQSWIDAGAAYEKHWAFVAPERATTSIGSSSEQATPAQQVDAIIDATLRRKGWEAAPAADSSELCRRLYLDVIGLPPTPEQLKNFESEGLEATLDRLLSDERYGERWARPWLDVARYSDTNGYEKDMRREQWIWREWVIHALNRDMPYDQFVVEQLAGDLLPNATQDQIIATGFLRNSMINEEGAIVPEQFRMVEMFDRMDCLGKGVLGMSLQCAQCHTHKFDPITHDEYFGMFAFFNNSYEAKSWVYTPEQQATIDGIEEARHSIAAGVRQTQPDWHTRWMAWRDANTQSLPKWTPLRAELLETISGLNHPVQQDDDAILMIGHTSNDVFMTAPPTLDRITGLQYEVLTHGELPFRGPGRNDVGTWDLREIELFVQRPGKTEWEKQTFASASADYSNPDQKAADGKSASGPVAYLIDGKDETIWKSDRGLGRRNQSSVAVLQLESPLENLADCKLKVVWRQGDMIGCCRISVTDAPQPSAPAIDHDVHMAMRDAAADPSMNDSLLIAWLSTQESLRTEHEAIEALWAQYPTARTSVLHMAEREPDQTRTTFTLQRGNWDQPERPMQPTFLTSLHPPRVEAEPPRLQLARWLVDKRSPLTARVAVNRIWQNVFGEGLVETSEDFGIRAPVPEYQAVLDTLAVELMDSGWSQKQLLRSILMTQAYQRTSRATEAQRADDPKNRWLTRGPRFRCDAETVRDIALSVAGLLHQQIGGPSVLPPVPQNVLDYNYVVPTYWKPATGPERYRRAVYMFRKRSMPDPVLTAFDAPNGDLPCARRVRSNTPLAALTGLNEPIFVEAARGFALRILRESSQDDEHRLEHAFVIAMSRSPRDPERSEMLRYLNQQRQRLADGWLNPREILTGDPSAIGDLPSGATPQDAAAWTLVARVLINLDETVTKQ